MKINDRYQEVKINDFRIEEKVDESNRKVIGC
jgi:hypothetical protein